MIKAILFVSLLAIIFMSSVSIRIMFCKWIIDSKMKIHWLFTHPGVIPMPYVFLYYSPTTGQQNKASSLEGPVLS